jgi:hypothetical protein
MELNSLFQVVVFIFGSIGFTQIVVDSEIAKPVKNLLGKFMPKFFMKLIDCYQCCGFWSGIICGLCCIDYNLIISDWTLVRFIFVCGCAGSCLSYFWAYFLTFLEANTVLRS